MAELTEPDTIRDQVREKYAAAARAAAAGAAAPASCCGPTEVPLTDASGTQVFGDALYGADEAAAAEQRGRRLARLRRADGGGRPARGRDRARPRLGRRRRRAHQRAARRARPAASSAWT